MPESEGAPADLTPDVPLYMLATTLLKSHTDGTPFLRAVLLKPHKRNTETKDKYSF